MKTLKLFSAVLFLNGAISHAAIQLDKIKLQPKFKIEVFASGISGARSMTWGENGTLFVGSRSSGQVVAITPDKKIHVIAKKLHEPNGVAFRDGSLYVAEISRISRFDKIESHLDQPPKPVVIVNDLPTDEHHGWKFIAFGPDKKLYIAVGAPCNVCEIKDPYAAILRMDADGKNREVFARGVRNTVGFSWHPVTHEMWFTDNGRDMMGDDIPSDELNRAAKSGLHFGYPFCHEGDLTDPEYAKGHTCSEFVPPEEKLGAHVASLGMRFYTGQMFPHEYKNQIFIAEHGSWNRSKKVGYRVVEVLLDSKGKVASEKIFADGWLQGESEWGRPVDVIVAPDGALLVSDDRADAIYRISYKL
jgi:glucose/arabinose dehydrogenase